MLHYKSTIRGFVRGGHRPKPFPGKYPTKIYYKLSLFKGSPIIYLGKPNVEVMKRFRRLLRANRICQYTIAEFDRSGVFAITCIGVRYVGSQIHHVSERFWETYHPFDAPDPTLSCFAVPFQMLRRARDGVEWAYYSGRK